MGRLAAQYVTAGGQTVDLQYSGDGVAVCGVVGKCTGCLTPTEAPVGELAGHEWAYKHAIQCTKRPSSKPAKKSKRGRA